MKERDSRFGLIIVGLLLGILMSAMDNTIVATAMGTIVAHLGGLDKFVWVTSAYMVTEMAGMPIFGKLSDMYGRKRFFIFGIILFLAGSMLCGTSQSITQLIVYRAIQGVGGGALAPIAFTIIFDVAPIEKRGTMGGMFGAVFGLASIFGPLLGAYITEYINWHWVFYINVPIGVAAFILVAFFYHESVDHARRIIDWVGVATLVPAIAAMMVALQLGGAKYAWGSARILGLFALAAALFAAFLFVETKVPEPIISYSMFRKRLFAYSSIISLLQGATYIVAVLYIPIFVQGVFGGTATNSGMTLLPMMLGTVIASQIGIVFARKVTFRTIMLVSGAIFAAGILALGTLTPESTRILVTTYMVIVGFGTGAFFSVLGVSSIQPFSAVQRGTASSTVTFLRSLGMTVGITVFGIVQRNIMQHHLTAAFTGIPAAHRFNVTDPHAILSPTLRAHIPTQVLTKITNALSISVVHTFLWALVPAVLVLVFVSLMGPERMSFMAESSVVEAESS
ncbi:MDR family MFS transporter [Alicyclobacillus sp. ALC3]|uniref:MDR family MFS transporter n=1 Tax=Alicyclobacillus sp. ALC3 TaxID=2796143 RepID=UPI00237829B7|nr:MDR family MFS transporter [Alicyclobacillus sp. ALC3]WDL96092.1 MFS transporter [Alicyclobacillus sp. ALC3]